MNPRILAHRTLKGLEGYRELAPGAEAPACLRSISFAPGETLIGVYENEAGHEEGAILVTDAGVHVLKEGPVFIAYAQIEKIDFPVSKREAKPALAVRLLDGRSFTLPILRGEGGGSDVWEFGRYLLRAVEQARSTSAKFGKTPIQITA